VLLTVHESFISKGIHAALSWQDGVCTTILSFLLGGSSPYSIHGFKEHNNLWWFMDYILTQVAKIFINFHPRNEKRHPFDWFAINNVNFVLLGYLPYVSDLHLSTSCSKYCHDLNLIMIAVKCWHHRFDGELNPWAISDHGFFQLSLYTKKIFSHHLTPACNISISFGKKREIDLSRTQDTGP